MSNDVLTLPDYSRVNWSTGLFLVLLHIGAFAALFHFTWPALVAALILNWIALSWGIGMGYHRLHTHRGYKAPRVLDYFLAI